MLNRNYIFTMLKAKIIIKKKANADWPWSWPAWLAHESNRTLMVTQFQFWQSEALPFSLNLFFLSNVSLISLF